MDTLRGVLDGEILVHNHCYRADEMAIMIDVAKEFGYKIASFQHAVEAYKIADLHARTASARRCGPTGRASRWKAMTRSTRTSVRPQRRRLRDRPFGRRQRHPAAQPGSGQGDRRGTRAGINISEEVAWTWLSANPARSLGIFDQTGSLKAGKMADVVLWNGNPFSAYTRPDKVWIDGALLYDGQSQASAGQRLRARPAGRRRREVTRVAALIAAALVGRRGIAASRADRRDHQRHAGAGRRVGADPGRHGGHPRRPDRRGGRVSPCLAEPK